MEAGFPVEVPSASFSTVISAFAPAASATDIVAFTGVTGYFAKLVRLRVFGVATANAFQAVNLVRRNSANTGGTPTAATAVSRDPNMSRAVASGWGSGPSGIAPQVQASGPTSQLSVVSYAANPTLGNLVGVFATRNLFAPATGTPQIYFDAIFDFAEASGFIRLPTLRVATDVIAINLGGGAVPAGLTLSIEASWTEDKDDI